MKTNLMRYGSLLIILVLVSACNQYDPLRKGTTVTEKKGEVLGEETLVSAELVQKTALASCKDCHGGTKQPYLGDTAAILKSLSKVQSEVFSNQMPPANQGYNPVSECSKEILKKWVDLGTPDNSDVKVKTLASCSAGLPKPPTVIPISQMPVDYQTLNERILQPKCLSCHNEKGDDLDARDILLYPYSELAAKTKLLGTSSDQSKLVRLVTRTDEDRMPPPDSKVQPLTPDEVEFLKKWIDAGHPEKVN